jgi:hypothetical protein
VRGVWERKRETVKWARPNKERYMKKGARQLVTDTRPRQIGFTSPHGVPRRPVVGWHGGLGLLAAAREAVVDMSKEGISSVGNWKKKISTGQHNRKGKPTAGQGTGYVNCQRRGPWPIINQVKVPNQHNAPIREPLLRPYLARDEECDLDG